MVPPLSRADAVPAPAPSLTPAPCGAVAVPAPGPVSREYNPVVVRSAASVLIVVPAIPAEPSALDASLVLSVVAPVALAASAVVARTGPVRLRRQLAGFPLVPFAVLDPSVIRGRGRGVRRRRVGHVVPPGPAARVVPWQTLNRATLDGTSTAAPAPRPFMRGRGVLVIAWTRARSWPAVGLPAGHRSALALVRPADPLPVAAFRFAGPLETKAR